MNGTAQNLKLAERGAILSICVYLLLSTTKLIVASTVHSDSLRADAFNNLSDIVGNIAVLIGLRMAQKPADSDHKFGHWKIEDIASLITSFIMFAVGFDVLLDTGRKIISRETTPIDPLGAWVGLISAIIMVAVYRYNKRLAKKVHSKALDAAAKDNLSDAVTSIGTAIAIFASSLNFPIVDKIAAIVITFFILKTAYDIFMESFFTLSDGFDDQLLEAYKTDILKIPKITAVKSQRGRMYGSNIYLDIVLEMSPDLSVYESHEITEQVEKLLYFKYQVLDVDIHVEPASIDEDELVENLTNKLFRYETEIRSKATGYETLLDDQFELLTATGEVLDKAAFISDIPAHTDLFQDFQMISVSAKTKRIRYRCNNHFHTSLWRRHEEWTLIFHQVSTVKKD